MATTAKKPSKRPSAPHPAPAPINAVPGATFLIARGLRQPGGLADHDLALIGWVGLAESKICTDLAAEVFTLASKHRIRLEQLVADLHDAAETVARLCRRRIERPEDF